MSRRGYPETPGFQGGPTSEAAADFIEPVAPSLRERILLALRKRDQTTYELSMTLGAPYESIGPRTTELKLAGAIVNTGRRGPSRNPRLTAIVWALTPAPGTQGRLFE
jgi:hypothetical protein